MLKVISYASHLDGNYQHYLASLHGKLDYIVHLEHQVGWDWGKLVAYQLECAIRYPDTLLIFIDLWDSLFVGDAGELEELLATRGPCMQSSRTCWPDPEKKALYERLQGEETSPWRYVNGTGPFGRGRDIERLIRHGLERYPIRPRVAGRHLLDHQVNDNDQRFYTDIYLDGLASLDTRCEVVQELIRIRPGELEYRGGRLHNLVTGSRPQFLHAAGRTWDFIPKEILRDHGRLM